MDPEELIPCPFDNTHMIRYKRFPYHIKECKKNYPNHNLEQCPFNARHWVPKPELRHHISICTDKRTIEYELEYQNSGRKGEFYGGNVSVPPYTTVYAVDTTENWDDDLDHPTFILGKTSAPHLKTINNNNNNIRVEVETVYVPSAKTAQTAALSSRRQEPAIEADVRMPKNVPQVLQSQQKHIESVQASQPLGRGYGRGYAVPSTQSSVQPVRGRGRGLMIIQANQPGAAQFRSVSDVVRSSSPSERSHLTNSRSSPDPNTQVNSQQQQVSSDSPYSSGSESPSPMNRLPPTSRGLGSQSRGVNAPVSWMGRGRVIPRSSETPSPPPTHSLLAGQQVSIGRGLTTVASQKLSTVGVGRGCRPVTDVTTPVAGIRPLDSEGSNSPYSMSDSDQFESDVEKDRQKHERKLRKKLKQIEKLELKHSQGHVLLQEEKNKLSQRAEITRELQELSTS